MILHEHIGIKLNAKFVNNLSYTDDMVILAETMVHLQRSIGRLYVARKKYGLEMNVKKTKFMLVTKNQTDTRNNEINLKQYHIRKSIFIQYLGTWISQIAQ